MTKKVLIIQQLIPEYRVDFFNLLKEELAKVDIDLRLIFGEKAILSDSPGNTELLRWGKMIPNRRIRLGKTTLYWQPVTKFLRDQDLVIVEKANKLILNYFLMAGRPFRKTKLGFWGHGRNLQDNSHNWKSALNLWSLKKCDWWWGYTQGVKEFLVKNHYPASQITVVQNAINTKALRRQLEEVDENELTVLKNQMGLNNHMTAIFCGRMYPEKRIDFILETCRLIKKEIPEFQMIFIGSGIESDKVKLAAETAPWIHYTGPLNGKDRVTYFKLASLQLMPGIVGLAILDSFALETPIVTTSHEAHSPEIEYLENGVNGVITSNTLEDYSETVIGLLKTNGHLKLVEGCINAANKYSIEKMVENFKAGIVSCLDTK